MELYGSYTSPFVRHCRIALMESGQPCTFIETDAASSARQSPMQKVPFLKYAENGHARLLTDSSAILKFVRELSGTSFFGHDRGGVHDYNHFCSANTLLDTALNLFFLEKDGITPAQSAYLMRQQSRLHTGLAELEQIALPASAPYTDGELRIACFLDWALFRHRIDITPYPNLSVFLSGIRQYPHFAETAPRG